MSTRDLGRPACRLAMAILLLPAGAAWGQAGRAPTTGPRPADRRPEWTALGLGGGGATFVPSVSPADPRQMLLGCDMSGTYRSVDGGRSWEMIHYRELSQTTRVRAAWHPTDPAVAFAAADGRGPLKVTRDRGATWGIVPGGPSEVSAIAIDPGRPDLMVVGGDGALHRSADGGRTWAAAGTYRGRLLGIHFDQTSPAEDRAGFAATDRGLLRSDDAGASWRELGEFAAGRIVSFAGGSRRRDNTCVLYCSVEPREPGGRAQGGIYRSDDRGATWARAMGPGIDRPLEPGGGDVKEPSHYEFVLTTDVDPSRVYASCGAAGRVLRSDDRGASWRDVLFPSVKSPRFNVGPNYLIDESGGGGDVISGLGINPADPDLVVVADWMDCYITRDGGKSWEAAHTRSAEPPGRRGKGMRWVHTGLVVTTAWNYYFDPFEPDRHYIAYTDIGYARSTDAGKTWYWQTGRPLRNTTYELAFDPSTPGTIWAAFADLHDIPNYNVIVGRHYFPRASGGVGLSTDFGATWADSSKGLPSRPITSVVVDPRSPAGRRTLYASAFEAGVFQSTDGGRTWTPSSSGLGAPGVNVRACRIILHRDGTLHCLVTALRKEGRFVPEGPGLYRSADAGRSWEWINRSRPLLWPKDYDVDPRDSRVIYLGASDAGRGDEQGGLYKTTDGGRSWSRVARKGGDCFGATVDPRRPDRVYLCINEGGDEPGLWLSRDAGRTWKALEGLPFRGAQRVAFDPRDPSIIYVSTFGGSVWRGPAE